MGAMKLPKLVKKVLYTLALRRRGDEDGDAKCCRFWFRKGDGVWFVEVHQEETLYVKMPITEDRLPHKIWEMAPRMNPGDVVEFVGVGGYEAVVVFVLTPKNEQLQESEFE